MIPVSASLEFLSQDLAKLTISSGPQPTVKPKPTSFKNQRGDSFLQIGRLSRCKEREKGRMCWLKNCKRSKESMKTKPSSSSRPLKEVSTYWSNKWRSCPHNFPSYPSCYHQRPTKSSSEDIKRVSCLWRDCNRRPWAYSGANRVTNTITTTNISSYRRVQACQITSYCSRMPRDDYLKSPHWQWIRSEYLSCYDLE